MFQTTITALRDQKSKEFGTCHRKCLWEQHKPRSVAPLRRCLRRGRAGGRVGRVGGCLDGTRGVRPAPRLTAAARHSLRPRETRRRLQARAAVPESRGRAAGGGLDRPGAPRRSGRSCCCGPERRRFASFLPSCPARPFRPSRPAAGARRWGRCPRGGAGRARRGRAEAEGAGLTYSAPAGPSRASR